MSWKINEGWILNIYAYLIIIKRLSLQKNKIKHEKKELQLPSELHPGVGHFMLKL